MSYEPERRPGGVIRMPAALSSALLLLALETCGCFYIGQNQYDEIVQKPYMDWGRQDHLTVLMECTAHNLYDVQTAYKVFATPYIPAVVLASVRVWNDRHHISDQQFMASAEDVAKANAGLYIDWKNNRFMDGRGNFFKGPLQLDSLMFMIHMENWTKDFPSFEDNRFQPDISDIESRIYLVNDQHKFVKPKYVWGRRRNMFTMDENLLVMFPLRKGDHHFLDGSEHMFLVIKELNGPGLDVVLKFDLSAVR